MAKKEYSLPDNFCEIMKRGDFEEIKAVFQNEEMLKYLTRSEEIKDNPLFLYSPCTEIYKWFVEQGFDITMKNECYGQPIHVHALSGRNNIEGIILAGADTEAKLCGIETPLQLAAKAIQPSSLSVLIRYGADVHIKYHGVGALDLVIGRWRNPLALRAVECMEFLINAGVGIKDGMKDRVIDICKDFDRCKADEIDADDLPLCEEAVTRMCGLFGMERPASAVHDGMSPITVTSADWRDRHAELWDMLVPNAGKCGTVQGEIVRIGGSIKDEIFDRGSAHWNPEFRKMLDALEKYYLMGNIPDEEEHREALELIRSIGINSDGDILRLCEINIHWVLANPEPIALGEVDYKR